MMQWYLYQTLAIVTGFLIDFLVGDPHVIPHPVVFIGKLISFLEKRLCHGERSRKDLVPGIWTAVIVAAISTAIPFGILIVMWMIHPIAFYIVSSIMCWQILAARQLVRESRRVESALMKGDTEAARLAVSYIVGRDTDILDETGICRAAVETVAENASDGVIAPLFWMLLFGAPGGFFYKSINTMDSMIGYVNDRYLYFGRAAARTDDVVNYLPARISALCMILTCPFCRLDGKNAYRIFKRDRYKHSSPNSAQTESTSAGALHVQLAGDAVYGGIVHKKEFIGDDDRPIEPADIRRIGHLMYAASTLMLVIGILLRIGAYLLCC